MRMSIWAKLLAGMVLLGLLAAGTLLWTDVYGIRRGCLAPPLDQAKVEAASDLNLHAFEAIVSKNYAAANDMLDLALSRLGDDYAVGRHRDETVAIVAAARAAAANSQLEIAARMKYDAMKGRIGLYRRRIRLSGLCHDMAHRWHLI